MICGRGVKKHPKTIYIYAPVKYKVKNNIEGQQNINGSIEKERNTDNSLETIEEIGFKRTVVFDIEDTYTKKGAKPIPFVEDSINNNTTEEFYNTLIHISPVPIKITEILGGAKGYYSKSKSKIFLSNKLSQDDRTSVLLHELCHCMYDDFNYKEDRNKSEIFVESVAFLVADYFNFDTSMCSFGYITNWAKNDINEVMKLGKKIENTAKEYIKLIEDGLNPQVQISA